MRVQDLPKKQGSIDAGAFAGYGGEIASPFSSSPSTAARIASSPVRSLGHRNKCFIFAIFGDMARLAWRRHSK